MTGKITWPLSCDKLKRPGAKHKSAKFARVFRDETLHAVWLNVIHLFSLIKYERIKQQDWKEAFNLQSFAWIDGTAKICRSLQQHFCKILQGSITRYCKILKAALRLTFILAWSSSKRSLAPIVDVVAQWKSSTFVTQKTRVQAHSGPMIFFHVFCMFVSFLSSNWRVAEVGLDMNKNSFH